MPPGKPQPQDGPISTILSGLRRGFSAAPRRRRDRGVTTLDAAVPSPGRRGLGEYRIDDLARLAGTTTRNIRGYRDRGLLHRRCGWVHRAVQRHPSHAAAADHLDVWTAATTSPTFTRCSAPGSRARIWARSRAGSAIAGTLGRGEAADDAIADARRLIADDAAFDRLVGSGLIRIEDDDAIVLRPKLIEAFNDVREYGITIDKLIDIHERVLPLVDQIGAILVQAGAEHVQDRIKPGEALPDDTEVAELITMLVRFRTQAVAAVTATLASSIETTIEDLVSRILADYVEKTRQTEPTRKLGTEGTPSWDGTFAPQLARRTRRGAATPIRWCRAACW